MWYDLLTLVILMYAMFRGAMKGVVWQLATIAALLMCFLFGIIIGGAGSFYSSGASAESMDRHAHLVSWLFVRVVRRGPRRS